MKIFRTVKGVQKYLKRNHSVAFVPTMGALHDGHLALIKEAQLRATTTVVSIYVNPTQFNDESDLEKYPRTITSDVDLLEAENVDILFYPTDEEVYPEGLDTSVDIDLMGIDTILEGAYRPGHFEGMMEVVNRLTDIVQPDYLMMGQKDIQQFAIVNQMLQELNKDIQLVMVPIQREDSGLARSSRNERLSKTERETASEIYATLQYIKENMKNRSVEELKKHGLKRLKKAGFKPDYLEIVNVENFNSVNVLEGDKDYVIAVAAWLGQVRLIDNLFIQKK